jgi:hypothetical protein
MLVSHTAATAAALHSALCLAFLGKGVSRILFLSEDKGKVYGLLLRVWAVVCNIRT